MKYLIAFAALAFSANLMAHEAPCEQSMAIDPAIATDKVRFVIVGELHGTDTAPEMFGDLVCSAVRQQPITVHLEFPASLDHAFQDYMLTGDEAALAQITDHWLFRSKDYDGRGSLAIYQLILRLRAMSIKGFDIVINATQPDYTTLKPQYYYELAMANNWMRAAAKRPEAKNYVLVGNFHAKRAVDETGRQSAASFLMPDDYVALNRCAEGGTAANMIMNDEGIIVSATSKLSKIGKDRERGIYPTEAFEQTQSGSSSSPYDGFYCAGRPSVASQRAFPARLEP